MESLNDLITTIIAATAGLVAIIGGFLVSRVIAIASEQNGIKRRIREIKNDLLAKREMKDTAEKFLFEDDLNDFVTDENINRMLHGKSLDTIITEDDYDYLTKDEVEPYYKQLQGMASEILSFINKSDDCFEKFNEFKQAYNDFRYPERIDWYEKIFKQIKEINDPEPQFPFGSLKFKPISHVPPNTDYKDTRKERDRLIDDIRVLELQQEEQLKILNDYGKPKWVWSGLFVLVYACIVGIVYPSTLLPYPKDKYDDVLTKWFLLGLFFSQLLALIIYLGIATYKLTNDKEDYK